MAFRLDKNAPEEFPSPQKWHQPVPSASANSSRPFCSCPFILLTYQILQLRLNATCACLHFRDREREKMNTRPDNPNLTNPNTWARDEKPDFIRGICCHHIAFATYSGGLAFHEHEVGGRNPCPKKGVPAKSEGQGRVNELIKN